MFNASAALPLVWLMLLSCGCQADDLSSGWDFQESAEFGEAPASDARAELDEDPDRDDAPEPVAPIERICDGNLPPEMTVSEPDANASDATLAIAPDGCPHVAWKADDVIYYAHWNGAAWISEAVYSPAHYHLALDVGRDGRPKLLVSHANEPRVLRLHRADDGSWVEEEVANHWTHGMRFVELSTDREVVLMKTSRHQYRQGDLALRVLERKGDQWSESQINDFKINFDRPLTMAVVSQGRGVVPVFEADVNKAYSPWKLWVATSTDETFSEWETERVLPVGFSRFDSASIVAIGETPHIIALAEMEDAGGERALLHLRPDSESGWRAEQFGSCAELACQNIRATADSDGRIHALFRFGESGERQLRYASYDEGQWSFRDLGAYGDRVAALEVDPVSDAVHAAARIHSPGGQLVYIPISPISSAPP